MSQEFRESIDLKELVTGSDIIVVATPGGEVPADLKIFGETPRSFRVEEILKKENLRKEMAAEIHVVSADAQVYESMQKDHDEFGMMESPILPEYSGSLKSLKNVERMILFLKPIGKESARFAFSVAGSYESMEKRDEIAGLI